jgi:polyferredoxin
VLSGKIQVWMIVFLSSFFAVLLFGRFYCGWICPINTVIEWIGKLYKHYAIKQRDVPLWMKKPFIRYSMLLVFLSVFIVVFITGKKLPVLPILFIVGLVKIHND